jgi:hypothetical protein
LNDLTLLSIEPPQMLKDPTKINVPIKLQDQTLERWIVRVFGHRSLRLPVASKDLLSKEEGSSAVVRPRPNPLDRNLHAARCCLSLTLMGEGGLQRDICR